MKRQTDLLPPWTPGIQEVAPIIEDLKRSSRLRKIVEKQKKIEEAAAKPLKRLLLKLGLGEYTKRLNDLRASLHKSEWAVLSVAYQLRAEKQRAWNQYSPIFDLGDKDNLLDSYNKFNNFCLGVTTFNPELGKRIELNDMMVSYFETEKDNIFI